MGTIFKIALRNILRHKRRTVSSAVVIAVGITFYLYMDGIMLGMDRGGIDNVIELSFSAITVRTKAYESDKEAYPLKHGIENVSAIRQRLSGDPRVIGITPRTQFLGELSNYEKTVPIVGIAVDPSTDTAVFKLKRFMEGEYLSGKSNEIVLGRKLAEDLGVDVGGFITLYALTKYDSRNADEFRVVGVLHTTDPGLNQSTVLISYATADEFLDLEGLVTEAAVALERRVNLKDMIADAGEVKDRIVTSFPDLSATTFMEHSAAFLELAKGKRAFGVVFLCILLLIAGIGIFNTVLMSVYERIREVGVLRAHGMPPSHVMLMFAMEGVVTGIVGSLLGLLLGGLITWYLAVKGFAVDAIYSDSSIAGDLPYWGTIHAEWNIPAFVAMFIFGVLVAVLAGVIPARKAAEIAVTDALRFV
ncbi:MAG: ABC transporter permease [Chitinispirillaceae bacterium]|nr:ABC transporter permease [Chitinispirillaceae bacterium]